MRSQDHDLTISEYPVSVVWLMWCIHSPQTPIYGPLVPSTEDWDSVRSGLLDQFGDLVPDRLALIMATVLQVLTDWGIATGVGLIANAVASRCICSDKIKGIRLFWLDVNPQIGDPRWVYYLSIFAQTAIFPPLCFLSWREQNYQISNWFGPTPWAALPSVVFSRAYLAALWGYWVRQGSKVHLNDLGQRHVRFVRSSDCHSSLFLHVLLGHFNRSKAYWWFRFHCCWHPSLRIRYRPRLFVLTSLGTAFYNISTIFPHNRPIRYTYWGLMTLSNFVAGGNSVTLELVLTWQGWLVGSRLLTPCQRYPEFTTFFAFWGSVLADRGRESSIFWEVFRWKKSR